MCCALITCAALLWWIEQNTTLILVLYVHSSEPQWCGLYSVYVCKVCERGLITTGVGLAVQYRYFSDQRTSVGWLKWRWEWFLLTLVSASVHSATHWIHTLQYVCTKYMHTHAYTHIHTQMDGHTINPKLSLAYPWCSNMSMNGFESDSESTW